MSKPGDRTQCDGCQAPGVCCAPGWDVNPTPDDEDLVTLLAFGHQWLCERCATRQPTEHEWNTKPYRKPRGVPRLAIDLRPLNGLGWEFILHWQDGRSEAYRTNFGGNGLWRIGDEGWVPVRSVAEFFLPADRVLARAKIRRIFV